MTLTMILIPSIAIIICTLLISGTILFFKKKNLAFQKYKLHIEMLDSKLIEDIQNMLDSLIESCFVDYLANNPDIANSGYINTDTEVAIIKSVSNAVSAKISETMYDKLILYYNKNALSNIIAEKIYLRVTAYVIEINQPK